MSLLQQLSTELEELVARTAPAVVALQDRRGQGSGVILAPDGYLLTNHHVVHRRSSMRVQFTSGADTEGRVVGSDPLTDLAVVSVDQRELPSLPLAAPERIEVGQLVIAIGNPFRFEGSVSLGVISALDRTIAARAGHAIEGVIQTDAAVNPGNSGGPLINAWGEVVGINTAIVPFAQGIGFAIPAQTASWVAGLLIQQGRIDRCFLGIAAKTARLTPELGDTLGQLRAVRVLAVEPGSPADQAGIAEGDLLLTADGAALGSVGDLQRILASQAGTEVRIDVWQRGTRRRIAARPIRRRAA